MWKLDSLVRLNPTVVDKLETFQMNDLNKQYLISHLCFNSYDALHRHIYYQDWRQPPDLQLFGSWLVSGALRTIVLFVP